MDFELATTHILCRSSSGKTYHLTPHTCPADLCEQVIWTCSCPVFTMGRVRNGTDPFRDPCKHIVELKRAGQENGLHGVIQEANVARGWGL